MLLHKTYGWNQAMQGVDGLAGCLLEAECSPTFPQIRPDLGATGIGVHPPGTYLAATLLLTAQCRDQPAIAKGSSSSILTVLLLFIDYKRFNLLVGKAAS